MQTDWRKRPRKYMAPDSRIPTEAPELWRGARASGESLEEFFRRVWQPYLQCGLQSVQIRRLDAALWKALHQHIVRYEMPWPADLEIPNLKPRSQEIVAKLDQGRWQELSDDEIISALMQRQREKVKQELHTLRQHKRELRQRRVTIRKSLRKRRSTAQQAAE